MRDRGRGLAGKAVRVHASGVVYRGTVVELGSESLILRTPSGFQEVPWDRVGRLEEDDGAGAGGSAGPLPPGWG